MVRACCEPDGPRSARAQLHAWRTVTGEVAIGATEDGGTLMRTTASLIMFDSADHEHCVVGDASVESLSRARARAGAVQSTGVATSIAANRPTHWMRGQEKYDEMMRRERRAARGMLSISKAIAKQKERKRARMGLLLPAVASAYATRASASAFASEEKQRTISERVVRATSESLIESGFLVSRTRDNLSVLVAPRTVESGPDTAGPCVALLRLSAPVPLFGGESSTVCVSSDATLKELLCLCAPKQSPLAQPGALGMTARAFGDAQQRVAKMLGLCLV